MFWIFKIFPVWFWWMLTLAGILSYSLSYLPLLKPYHQLLKIVGGVVVACGIFINGMYYADSTWKSAAAELQAKVDQLTAQSQTVNEVIKYKTITKLQVVKVRGEKVIEYINNEVAKTNSGCLVSPEFVKAHNSAAELPK